MAKENPTETRTSIDDLNDSLTGLEQKIEKNSKTLVWIGVALAAVVAVVLIYVYLIRQPGIAAANDAIGQADIQSIMGNDSIALAQYQAVADDHGYDAGNRAALNAAIILYKQGKWQEALDYVRRYKAQDDIIAAAAKSLEGDCLVNLKQYDAAVKAFADAAAKSDENPAYTPTFLFKQATVLRELKQYKEEAAIYQQIMDDYPAFCAGMQIDIEKYLKRAQIEAGE